MLLDVSYLAAFLVGLLGGVHCVGMCGSIVGALTLDAAPGPRGEAAVAPARLLPLVLSYNVGRILSYTLAGTLMGGLGYLAAHLVAVHQAQRLLEVVAGVFMIALGLYLGGWWSGLARVEQAGARLWGRIQPLGRTLLPVRTARHALLLGLLWGWLPCGLVYSVLIWAIAAGSAAEGGLLMLSFGLGTLPTLLAMGIFYTWLSRAAHHMWVRRGAGALILLFGIQTLMAGTSIP